MENKCRSIFDAKIIFGLVIITAGLILFLENMDIIGYVNLWEWWPVLLILLGIGQIAQPKECRQTWSGLILLVVGLLFLGNNLDWFYFRFRDLWPIILILVGFAILKQSVWGRHVVKRNHDFIHLSFILGGGDHVFASKTLQGGKVTAIMGGGSIDLRDADFEGSILEFDVFAFWGGFDITVPKEWLVNVQAMPILGGIENKTRTSIEGTGNKQIIIRGTVIMGGVEVKN